jgi:hypothetical protein
VAGFINIPSKIGQVAAVRTLARQCRGQDAGCRTECLNRVDI